MTRIVILSLLALAACQQPSTNGAAGAEEQKQLDAPVKEVETLPPDETVVENADDVVNPATGSTTIPDELQGRWGMVANDCDPKRADAKGLMTVTADTLRFYESRAKLDKVANAAPDSFAGTFSFNGEGQQWKADITLSRSGDTLSRTEGEQRFTYKRCA